MTRRERIEALIATLVEEVATRSADTKNNFTKRKKEIISEILILEDLRREEEIAKNSFLDKASESRKELELAKAKITELEQYLPELEELRSKMQNIEVMNNTIETLALKVKSMKKNLQAVDSRAASAYKPQITKLKKKITSMHLEYSQEMDSILAALKAERGMTEAVERALTYIKTGRNIHPKEIVSFIEITFERAIAIHKEKVEKNYKEIPFSERLAVALE